MLNNTRNYIVAAVAFLFYLNVRGNAGAIKKIIIKQQTNLQDASTTGSIERHGAGEGQISVQIFDYQKMKNSANSSSSLPSMTTPSFLQAEVDSIIHIPHEGKIVVNFRDSIDRKCLNPRIFGRLSGQHLSMIHWDRDIEDKMRDDIPRQNRRQLTFDNNTRTDVITGHYLVPSQGRYYIEIIGLLCNDFPFDVDFNPICLEDVDHNHLTEAGSFIDVTTGPVTRNITASEVNSPSGNMLLNARKEPVGYWKWTNSTLDPVPMTTRYQGQNCRGQDNSKEDRCMTSGSLDRFKPYIFEWSDIEMNILKNIPELNTSNETYHICAAGNSHSRELVVHFNYWLNLFNISNVKAWQLTMSYPADMRRHGQMAKKAIGCNITIVGLGQWSAGKKPRLVVPATTLPEYLESLERGILNWKALGIKMILRKIHYNPLGDLISQCPPTDRRSPPVIDGYNEIVESLAQKHNITYIDTGDVMDPMWDSAGDYCHYRGLEGSTEALYILQEIFRSYKSCIHG